jgi:hypothetical protein
MPAVMNRRRESAKALWIMVAAAGLAVGCGDGAGSNVDITKPFAAGIEVSRSLRDVNAADLGQVCGRGGQYIVAQERANRAGDCRATAFNTVFGAWLLPNPLTDAEMQARCQAVYDSCFTGVHGSPGGCGMPEPTCTSTVADIETCVNDEGKYLLHLGDGLPECSKVTAALAASIAWPPDPVKQLESCFRLGRQCPGLRFLEL